MKLLDIFYVFFWYSSVISEIRKEIAKSNSTLSSSKKTDLFESILQFWDVGTFLRLDKDDTGCFSTLFLLNFANAQEHSHRWLCSCFISTSEVRELRNSLREDFVQSAGMVKMFSAPACSCQQLSTCVLCSWSRAWELLSSHWSLIQLIFEVIKTLPDFRLSLAAYIPSWIFKVLHWIVFLSWKRRGRPMRGWGLVLKQKC